MKTHLVIDQTYHEDEGNQVFAGTRQECEDWAAEQGFGYKVVPMTKEELRIHNPKNVAKTGHFFHYVPPELDVDTWDNMTIAERLLYKDLIEKK